MGECALIGAANWTQPPFIALLIAHVATLSAILALTWRHRWTYVATGAAAVAWVAARHWELVRLGDRPWHQLLALSAGMYAVFVAYPMLLGRRAGRDRDPYLAAVVASAMCFFGARAALEAGGYGWGIGVVPIALSAVLAILLRELLRIEAAGQRDLGRLALIAGAALAFVTVAIPLQLRHQWITIGWALEGAALAWVYRRIPHRGLLYSGVALMTAVFVAAGAQPRRPVLRAARRDAYLQLVSVRVRDLRRRVLRGGLVVRPDRRSRRRIASRRTPAAGRGRHPAVPAAEHRDR